MITLSPVFLYLPYASAHLSCHLPCILSHRPASNLLLETMGFARLGQSDGGVVVSKVELDGWNTSDMRPEDLKPLENWRDLKPRLISRQYSHPPL